jgi:cytochrome c553
MDIPPCSACHGPGGYKLGAPALQRQQPNYIEEQLIAFAQGLRQNDIFEQMRIIARQLTPDEMHSIAVFYGALASASGAGSIRARSMWP